MQRNIHGIKWLLMGLALIAFAIPFSVSFNPTSSSSGFSFETILITFCAFSPFIGLAMCIYGFFKKD